MEREMFWTRDGGLGSQIWSGGTPREGKKKKDRYIMVCMAEQNKLQVKKKIYYAASRLVSREPKKEKKNMNKRIDEGNLRTYDSFAGLSALWAWGEVGKCLRKLEGAWGRTEGKKRKEKKTLSRGCVSLYT